MALMFVRDAGPSRLNCKLQCQNGLAAVNLTDQNSGDSKRRVRLMPLKSETIVLVVIIVEIVIFRVVISFLIEV